MEVDGKLESARLGVATLSIAAYSITLNDMVAFATLLYLIIQMLVLLPKAIESVRVLYRKAHMRFCRNCTHYEQ